MRCISLSGDRPSSWRETRAARLAVRKNVILRGVWRSHGALIRAATSGGEIESNAATDEEALAMSDSMHLRTRNGVPGRCVKSACTHRWVETEYGLHTYRVPNDVDYLYHC